MSHLKQYLKDTVGLESLDMSDGETKLDVIDNTEASVSHVMAEIVEAEIEQDEIHRDGEALLEAQSAMEQYMLLLEESAENGGLSSQSAAFLRVGMERYETMLGCEEPLTPSVEAFGGSASRMQSTRVSMESIGEALKKTWEVIKKMLEQLWNAIQDVYQKATSGTDKVKQKAFDLMGRANKIRNHTVEGTLQIRNPSRLMADGEWFGDQEGAVYLQGLSTAMLENYPNLVFKHISKVADIIAAYDPGARDNTETLTKLFHVDNLDRVFFNDLKGVSDPRFGNSAKVEKTGTLPGNVAVYVTGNASPKFTNRVQANISAMRGVEAMRVEILSDPKAKPTPEKYELKVLTNVELSNHAKVIHRLMENTKSYLNKSTSRTEAMDRLKIAGDRLAKRLEVNEYTSEQHAEAREVLRSAARLNGLMSKSINGFISYIVRTAAAHLAIIELQLDQYSGSK